MLSKCNYSGTGYYPLGHRIYKFLVLPAHQMSYKEYTDKWPGYDMKYLNHPLCHGGGGRIAPP